MKALVYKVAVLGGRGFSAVFKKQSNSFCMVACKPTELFRDCVVKATWCASRNAEPEGDRMPDGRGPVSHSDSEACASAVRAVVCRHGFAVLVFTTWMVVGADPGRAGVRGRSLRGS